MPGEAWWLLRRAHDAQAPAHVHVEEVQLLEFVITPLHPAGELRGVTYRAHTA